MSIEMILIIVLLAVIVVSGTAVICILVKGQNEDTHVILKGGMDADTQKNGKDRGKQFSGIEERGGTWCINPARGMRMHTLIFINLLTREQYKVSFRRQMGIGRAENVQGAEAFLTIQGDNHLSRIQCWLTEYNGQIYIENAGGRNPLWLDDKIVTTKTALSNNAVIRAGNTRLRVQFGGNAR